MSPLVALIVVPVTAALVAGFGLDTARFMVTGVQQTASVAAMFVFAILYFGVMTDAGLLDPIVDRILRAVGTQSDTHRRRDRAPRLARTPRWIRRCHIPRDHSGDASALRTPRDGSTRSRVRGVDGGGCQLLALDGSDGASGHRATRIDNRSVQAFDSRAGDRSGICVWRCRDAGTT
jgi:hypothetical protein